MEIEAGAAGGSSFGDEAGAGMGRNSYSVRGRGAGTERGHGCGRGGHYLRPHEEEDRSFSRPRTFKRSQSDHERVCG